MSKTTFFNVRIYFTALVSLAMWSLLAWNHYHGGVPNHHLLAREDLPSISNWWGAVSLPLLTWFLLYRVQKRMANQDETVSVSGIPQQVVYSFVGALAFGIALSVFFTLDYSGFPVNMLKALLIAALFFPIYRAECMLGFVIGMTFTFGAVLPMLVGSVLAILGAVLYLLVRPMALKFLGFLSPDKDEPRG